MQVGSLVERVPAPVREIFAALREHRASALAATAAFYALLSIPPLIVGFVATAAIIAIIQGQQVVDRLYDQILSIAGQVLSPETTADVVRPSLTQVLEQPSPGVLSLGYLLALWSASRMTNALLQGIEILTEQDEARSAVRTRLLAIKTLLIGLLVITILLPILAIGPSALLSFLGASPVVTILGWIVATALGVAAMTLFFRSAIPDRPSWTHGVVGALVTITGWGLGSVILQWWAQRAVSGPSIYGPLAAPIALLLWLQLMAWVTLLGAAVINQLRAKEKHPGGSDRVRRAR